MTNPSHRDHINAVKAKRIREDLNDDEADHLEALIAAAQKKDHDRPVYRELVKPANEMQTGSQA